MRYSNPTIKTQEEIFEVIEKSKEPLTISAIARETNKSISQVKSSVQFFVKFGVLITITSSGGTTLVMRSKENHAK